MRKKTNIRPEYFIYVANKPRSETVDHIGQHEINRLRKVLNDIVTQGKLTESYELDLFIGMAENYTSVTHKTFRNGKLKDIRVDEKPLLSGMLTPEKQNFLHFELSKSLCYFLGKKGNLKKIKICRMCNEFFIAKDVRRIICYKKACFNKYHKEDMQYRRKRAKKLTITTATAKSKQPSR